MNPPLFSKTAKFVSWLVALALFLTPLAPAFANPARAQIASAPAGGGFTVTTIYTNIPGHPSADVPGMPGVHFGPGTGSTHFDRPFGSPNGNWTLTADTDLAATEDEIILVNGVVKAREGTAATWTTGELIGLIDTRVPINDSGEWAFATNTDGITTADEYMVTVSATDVFTSAAQEGDSIPALPAATWGSTIETGVIAADGTVGLSSDVILGVPTTTDDILVLGSTLLGQEGVTVPPGQLGAEFWENFNLEEYFLSADGTHWLVQGDLTGDTSFDSVVVVDGSVVAQESVILPGTPFVNPVDVGGFIGSSMAPNGDWFIRGNNDLTEQDWIYTNNGLLTTIGDPIYVSATEVFTDAEFSDCFFLHIGDSNGNYVIGGVTNGPTLSNGVLVANETAVIVRESDPIDLDNNSIFDDDAFFNTFGNDDGYLSDAGIFYFTATIKNGAGTVIGQGFFSVDISSLIGGNTAPILSNVAVNSPILESQTATLTGNITDPDLNDTFTLDVNWGEGAVMTYTYPAGTTVFTETHIYLDDNPTGTPEDDYTINLVLQDSAGGMDTDSTILTVQNFSPMWSVWFNSSAIDENEVFTLYGSINDPSPYDTFTVTMGWGDGITETYTYPAGPITYTITHTYTDDSPSGTPFDLYFLSSTLIDDDLGSRYMPPLQSIRVNNVAPTLTNLFATSVDENGLSILTGNITDPSPLDTFTLTVDWDDSTVMTYTYPAGTTAFTETHTYPEGANPVELLIPLDTEYTVTLTLADDDGGQDTGSTTTSVTNVAPTITSLAATSPVAENNSTTLIGTFNDPGTLDTFTVMVDWGDGSVLTATYPAGAFDFMHTHQYLDDDPTGTASDLYTVTVTLMDDDGGSDTATTSLTVNNVAPTVDAGADQTVDDGTELTFTGVFTDPGTLDTHTILWDFGDGNTVTGTLSTTHTFASPGVYTVTLTITDDDGGMTQDIVQVTVNETGVPEYLIFLPIIHNP